MNLQTLHDLAVAERDHGARIAAEVDRGTLDPGAERVLVSLEASPQSGRDADAADGRRCARTFPKDLSGSRG